MASSPAASAALKAVLAPAVTISAVDLAAELDVTPQAVYNWMNGAGRPAVAHRKRVEELTGVPSASWLTDAERDAAGLPPREVTP